MDAGTRAVLNETEQLLIAETGRDALAALDEDAAIELEAVQNNSGTVRSGDAA